MMRLKTTHLTRIKLIIKLWPVSEYGDAMEIYCGLQMRTVPLLCESLSNSTGYLPSPLYS